MKLLLFIVFYTSFSALHAAERAAHLAKRETNIAGFDLNSDLGYQSAPSEEELLCGSIDDVEDDLIQLEKLTEIEKQMPPVVNQAGTRWCNAFAAIDLIHHHNHIFYKVPYNESTLISPIDAFAMAKKYEFETVAEIPIGPTRVATDETANNLTDLQGLRHARALLSQKQLPFYIQDASTFEMGILNPKLYSLANKNGLASSARSVDNYELLRSQFGEPMVHIPNYKVGILNATEQAKINRQLRKILNKGLPVRISSICESSHRFGLNKLNLCENRHAMIVVGAQYINNKCHIRLRNSWGQEWRSGGYISVPYEQFKSYLPTSIGETATISWIDKPLIKNGHVHYDDEYLDDTVALKGELKYESFLSRYDSGALLVNGIFSVINGFKRSYDGSYVEVKGGEATYYYNVLIDDIQRFTGSVRGLQLQNGVLKTNSGSRVIQDNKFVN